MSKLQGSQPDCGNSKAVFIADRPVKLNLITNKAKYLILLALSYKDR